MVITKKRKKTARSNALGWVFCLPWIIGFVFYLVIPLGASLYLSFTEWDMFNTPTWVGLENYRKLLDFSTPQGQAFSAAFSNTTLYTLGVLVLNFVVGISIAWAISKKSKLNSVLRVIIYMPTTVISVAFAIMMSPILGNTDFSIVNRIRALMGLPQARWLMTRGPAVVVMILMGFWGIGGPMLVYLSGFKSVDTSVYEAAQIDGTSNFKTLLKIAIPMIAPVIVYQLTMTIVNGLQVFDLAVGLASIGGSNSTLTMGGDYSLATFVYYLYNKGFKDFEMGLASAIGWLVFLITSVFSVGLLAFVKKTGFYSLDD